MPPHQVCPCGLIHILHRSPQNTCSLSWTPRAQTAFVVNNCKSRLQDPVSLMVTVKVGLDEYNVSVECGGNTLEEWALTREEHQQDCWVASEADKVSRLVFQKCHCIALILAVVGIPSYHRFPLTYHANHCRRSFHRWCDDLRLCRT